MIIETPTYPAGVGEAGNVQDRVFIAFLVPCALVDAHPSIVAAQNVQSLCCATDLCS